MSKTLVIGFGNLLMSDDGAGIHAVQRLTAYSFPAHVEVIDGGVNSFAALSEIKDAAKVIFIDAVNGGGGPGDIYRFSYHDFKTLPSGGALSVHDFNLLDTLHQYEALGELPPITIYGIEPAVLEMGLELSDPVSAAVDKVISYVLSDI